MKIYLAHNLAAKNYLNSEIVPKLVAKGHEITSRWLGEETSGKDSDYKPELMKEFCDKDLEDICNANCLILFCDQLGSTPGRGKFIELGFGIAKEKWYPGEGIKIYVVGKDCNESVFFFHDNINGRFKTFEELLEVL